MTEIKIPQRISDAVINFFEGDGGKIRLWFITTNPMLGGLSPAEMILMGREDRLEKFVNEAMEANEE